MNALPRPVGLRDVELDEGAGIMLLLPRRGLLAGAEPHDDIADSRRLAGLQRDIARLTIALVEQAQHRDPILHRRRAGLGIGRIARYVDRLHAARNLGLVERRRRRGRRGHGRSDLLSPIPVVSCPTRRPDPCQRRDDADDAAPVHASGVQAS